MSAVTDGSNPLYDLTGFQRDLLVALDTINEEDPCGLDLRKCLSKAYECEPGNEINHGRLYPNLDTLAEMGLVDKQQSDRRSNSYSLTARGERELEAHREWVGA